MEKYLEIQSTRESQNVAGRITTNTIPVKEILGQRVELENLGFVLCRDAQETTSHLFFHCPMDRAIWFSSCWGLRVQNHNISSCMDIIKLNLDPPNPSTYDIDEELISSTMTFVLDEIRHLRKQVIFQDGIVDIQLSSNHTLAGHQNSLIWPKKQT